MEKKEKIDEFQEVLWKDRKNYQPEMPPWEHVDVLDVRQNDDGSFLVLVKRRLQNLLKMTDCEAFHYAEVYEFREEEDQITYKLLGRTLFRHSYAFDGYPSLFNTRRYKEEIVLHDPDKQLVEIISDMKFLTESGKELSLRVGEIEELREFKYRHRSRQCLLF